MFNHTVEIEDCDSPDGLMEGSTQYYGSPCNRFKLPCDETCSRLLKRGSYLEWVGLVEVWLSKGITAIHKKVITAVRRNYLMRYYGGKKFQEQRCFIRKKLKIAS